MIKIWDTYRVPGKVRVVYALIALNLFAHLVTSSDPSFILYGGVRPAEWFNVDLLDPRRPPVLVTVVWSLFLHNDWGHLFWNSLFLLLFGPNIEAKLKPARFTLFYFACGAAATLAHVLSGSSSDGLLIGASGAISGLLGGYLVWFHDHFFRIRLGIRATGYRELLIPIMVVIIIWLVPQLVEAFLPLPNSTSHVAYMTHVGGFACGFLMAYASGLRLRRGLKSMNGGRSGSHGPFTND